VNGESLTLFAVSSQPNEFTIEKRYLLAHEQNPDMSAVGFEQYAAIVLIQFIDSLGVNEEPARKSLILLMNCFSLEWR
jgi:hypothetical protein